MSFAHRLSPEGELATNHINPAVRERAKKVLDRVKTHVKEMWEQQQGRQPAPTSVDWWAGLDHKVAEELALYILRNLAWMYMEPFEEEPGATPNQVAEQIRATAFSYELGMAPASKTVEDVARAHVKALDFGYKAIIDGRDGIIKDNGRQIDELKAVNAARCADIKALGEERANLVLLIDTRNKEIKDLSNRLIIRAREKIELGEKLEEAEAEHRAGLRKMAEQVAEANSNKEIFREMGLSKDRELSVVRSNYTRLTVQFNDSRAMSKQGETILQEIAYHLVATTVPFNELPKILERRLEELTGLLRQIARHLGVPHAAFDGLPLRAEEVMKEEAKKRHELEGIVKDLVFHQEDIYKAVVNLNAEAARALDATKLQAPYYAAQNDLLKLANMPTHKVLAQKPDAAPGQLWYFRGTGASKADGYVRQVKEVDRNCVVSFTDGSYSGLNQMREDDAWAFRGLMRLPEEKPSNAKATTDHVLDLLNQTAINLGVGGFHADAIPGRAKYVWDSYQQLLAGKNKMVEEPPAVVITAEKKPMVNELRELVDAALRAIKANPQVPSRDSAMRLQSLVQTYVLLGGK